VGTNGEADYSQYMAEQEARWEGLCRRCGACCGVPEDPCEHLVGDRSGKYHCDIYGTRFGARRTVSGKEFNCVPLRDILHKHWAGDYLCAYKENLKLPWQGII